GVYHVVALCRVGADDYSEVGTSDPLTRRAVARHHPEVLGLLDEDETPVLRVGPALGEPCCLEYCQLDFGRNGLRGELPYIELCPNGFGGVHRVRAGRAS